MNYEGSNSWNITNIETESDIAQGINKYLNTNLDTDTSFYVSSFEKQDGKYFSNIINNTLSKDGEISFGSSMSGVKGFYMKAKAFIDSSEYQELFSVSTNYNINSY